MSSKPFFGEPIFAIIYGPPKAGKTTDCLYSFPNAVFVALPAALKPSVNTVGIDIPKERIITLNRIADASNLLKALPASVEEVVVDDFSHMAERTMSKIEEKKSGWKVFSALRDELIEFRETARECKKHVLMNCHETAPTTKNGSFIRGGPRLPGRMPEDMPSAVDTVLRTAVDPERIGPWPGVYRCTPLDLSYITGDRHGIARDMAPMNAAEMFRAAGYTIRRTPAMEPWAETVVSTLARSIVEKNAASREALQPIILNAISWMAKQGITNLLHINWAIRDGIDRAIIHRMSSNILLSYGL